MAWVFTGCHKGTMRYLGSLRHEIPKWVRYESQKGTPHTQPFLSFAGPFNPVPIPFEL